MEFPEPVDYLVIGHICRDLTPDGSTIGGTAAYSAATAKTLGCRTAVVTSFADSENWQDLLPGIAIHRVTSPVTTTFENRYQSGKRVQGIHYVAGAIYSEDIPLLWRRAKIAHIGPVADEVDPAVVGLFSNSIVGLTPQGWMRAWSDEGEVMPKAMSEAETTLPLAAVTFISDEDLAYPAMLHEFRQLSRVLVFTQGPAGSVVYFGNEVRSFPAPRVKVQDPTGAGDIYATAYLIRLHQTGGDPWESARFANFIAAQSVTVTGLVNKMRVLADYRLPASG